MRARLLSDSCTKGWASWGHGELWLTDNEVVRIGKPSLTARAAFAGAAAAMGGALGGALSSASRTGQRMRPSATEGIEVTPEQWSAYLAEQKDVLVLPTSEIMSVTVKTGLSTSALAVKLRDGSLAKLLWKRAPGVVEALRESLQ